jgi:hypothetical protein
MIFYESFENENTASYKTIMKPNDYLQLPQMKSVGNINFIQIVLRGVLGDENFNFIIDLPKRKKPLTYNYTIPKSESMIILPIQDVELMKSLKIELINQDKEKNRNRGIIISSLSYNGIDMMGMISDPYGGKNKSEYQELLKGNIQNIISNTSYTYLLTEEKSQSIEIMKGIWFDENGFEKNPSDLEGEVRIIGMFESDSLISNVMAKVNNFDISGTRLIINGNTIELNKSGMTTSPITLDIGVNFVEILMKLKSPIQRNFATITLKVGEKTIRDSKGVPFDSNTPSLWRYNFEKNSYLPAIILPGYDGNKSCALYCANKKEDILKLSPQSSGRGICLNGVTEKGTVVGCDFQEDLKGKKRKKKKKTVIVKGKPVEIEVDDDDDVDDEEEKIPPLPARSTPTPVASVPTPVSPLPTPVSTPVIPTRVVSPPVISPPVIPTRVAPTPVVSAPVAPTPVAPTPTPVVSTPVAPAPVVSAPVIPTRVAPTPVAPTPTPPVTINAPVVGDVEAVDAVTANPETDSISVNGLKKNVLSLDTAEPEDEEDGVNNTG